jgi:hypothetical protein
LGMKQGKNITLMGVCDRDCSLHGNQEAERERERVTKEPEQDKPFKDTQSVTTSSNQALPCNSPLMKLVPSWSNHLSIVPTVGGLAFNTWPFGWTFPMQTVASSTIRPSFLSNNLWCSHTDWKSGSFPPYTSSWFVPLRHVTPIHNVCAVS